MPMPGLSDHELTAWYPYLIYSGALLAVLDADLRRECGITHPDYGILMQIAETDGHMRRMGDIAATLSVQASFLTYRIDRLVQLGLVERVRDGRDRRGVNARLTSDGISLLDRADEVHVAGVRRYFLDHVDPARLADLSAVFWSLHDHLVDPCSVPAWAERARRNSGDPGLQTPGSGEQVE